MSLNTHQSYQVYQMMLCPVWNPIHPIDVD